MEKIISGVKMNNNINLFDNYYEEYEQWFETNKNIYLTELNLIKSFIENNNYNGIEIGAGTGRFAIPLGIKIGIEPATKMAFIAEKKGLKIIKATAENIPLPYNSFDFVLFVTTICFVNDPILALKESFRILKNNGFILIGFVPADSKLGKYYISKKDNSKFYKNANFFTTNELITLIKNTGFKNIETRQTLFEITNDYIQEYKDGHKKGNFVVIKGEK